MSNTNAFQKELLEQGKYAEAVIDMIGQSKGTTFAQIEKFLAPHMEIDGDLSLYNLVQPTLIFWIGMSAQFSDVMVQVMRSGKVEGRPTSPLTYHADGKVPTLPVAKKAMQHTDPHWVPLAFYPSK